MIPFMGNLHSWFAIIKRGSLTKKRNGFRRGECQRLEGEFPLDESKNRPALC
jgi:hypothetical protein